MVGEIRDRETAVIAIEAALTGHLVLSSLHTNNAPSSIIRLMDIGIQPYLIGATLLGVLAQRLIRTLCPHCKLKDRIDRNTWNNLIAPAKATLPESICKPVGCDECRQTGYLGRTGIYETMMIDANMRDLINTSKDLDKFHHAAVKQGMRTLNISGAQKIAEGLTTLEEIYSVIPPHEEE